MVCAVVIRPHQRAPQEPMWWGVWAPPRAPQSLPTPTSLQPREGVSDQAASPLTTRGQMELKTCPQVAEAAPGPGLGRVPSGPGPQGSRVCSPQNAEHPGKGTASTSRSKSTPMCLKRGTVFVFLLRDLPHPRLGPLSCSCSGGRGRTLPRVSPHVRLRGAHTLSPRKAAVRGRTRCGHGGACLTLLHKRVTL